MSETPNPNDAPAVRDDGWCFVCGPENPSGLRIAWALLPEGIARARFLPRREHQGWSGVAHGGILSALLDEAMAQCLRGRGIAAMTIRLEVRFRAPLAVGRAAIVEGRIESEGGRGIRMTAGILDAEDGTVYAEANGVCVRVAGSWREPDGGESRG